MAQAGLVTALFTDLVDSTELLGGLGPDAADELRRAHFQSLRDAIGAHGGHEVKNVGDGLMVTFERPSDGAACAVDMQRQTARLSRRYPALQIAMRVGLAVGEATNDDGDWFGPPVVEAARLCAAAGGGEILATDVVRTLGGRASLDFVSRGAMTLKGLANPVNVVEILWAPEPTSWELPPLLESVGSGFFVGRELEAARLTTAWKRSLEGRRHAVLVAGEPGVGKTRLARELAVTAGSNGATVLYGRCDEEVGLPYQPFVEALEYYVASAPKDVIDRHVAAWGSELTRILPELRRRVPDIAEPMRGDPEVERYRLFEAVVDILHGADDGAGVVCILDDLHWADKGTLLLLRHLLRGGDPLAVLVVGTYRDTDLARTHPLAEMLADFRRLGDVERLTLSGLDPAAVEAFVEAAAGQRLAPDGLALARAVYDETEGNPFFLGQVLRHLVESGVIYQRDGRWRFDGDVEQLGIPEGVREVIGRRLSRLSEATNVVLHAAAVVGREFALGLVAEMVDLDEDAVVQCLEEAAAARLVVEVPTRVDQFSFTHALVRESLYGELSTSRRIRLHRRVGAALERSAGAPLATLAHHFCEAAATGEVDKAVDYALRAGAEAQAALAHDDAARLFRQGLEVLDAAGIGDVAVRGELLLGLVAARDVMGDLDAAQETAVTAAGIARTIGDAALFGRAALASIVGVPGVVDETCEALLDEAVALLPPDDSWIRARVLAARANAPSVILTHSAERDGRSDEGLAMARRVGDPDTLAFALAFRHNAIWGPENVEERLALADEMVAHSAGGPLALGPIYRMVDLYELGDIVGSRLALDTYSEWAESIRTPAANVWRKVWTANFQLFAGQLADAEATLLDWFSDHRGVHDDVAAQSFGVQFFDLRRAQGRCEEVEPPVRALVEQHPENTGWRAGLAMLLTELDRRDEVADLFEAVASDGFSSVMLDSGFILNVALLTEACAYLGDADRAVWLYDALTPYAGRNIVVGGLAGIGAASRYLGMLATTMERWDDAKAHFEQALAMNERMGARPWLARTAYDFADMLLRAEPPSEARRARALELLDLAGSLADDIGMPVLARRVAARYVMATR